MNTQTRFRYRLNDARTSQVLLWRIRPFLFLAATILALTAAGTAVFSESTEMTLPSVMTLVVVALVAVLVRRGRAFPEMDGLPIAGDMEPTRGGLVIYHGSTQVRISPWHAFTGIAWDPTENCLTLVPEHGWAVSLTRADCPQIEALAAALKAVTKVEIEQAVADDGEQAVADDAKPAVADKVQLTIEESAAPALATWGVAPPPLHHGHGTP